MKLLILRLEGALQSWGERSHWDHRDTANFPTKSGVVGLLGCALGLERGDARLAGLANALALAVRADRYGSILVDYYTIQSMDGNIKAAGGDDRGSDTINGRKEYLEDACFTAFLSGPEDVLRACAGALRHPVWTPCLGRRSCPPARPLLPHLTDEYVSLEDAARRFRWEGMEPAHAEKDLYCEIEDAAGTQMRNDQPLDASHDRYAPRRVRLLYETGGYPCS